MGDPAGTNPLANTGAAIENLVERFERNIDAYRQGKYNETLVRREFIDPMFAALGWDIDNRAGYAEAYRDVIHEDAIKVGGATKAPDYCFRVGGTRKFFVEAKKPSVDIHRDTSPAYQLRRYGWSAKLPLSILTDFEEFAVYDCRIRPKQGDKASTARTMYFTFDTYVAQWDKIASVFAKEAVLQGSFDKYVIGRKKRGTAEVDAEFLKEIEKWRAALARNIARRNPRLGVREINFAVQRTIDRIIFLRMCEDRGAESYGGLQALMNGIDVYGRLMQMFRAADDRYNSGLFHFNAEKGRAHAPDTLTPGLKIDDKILKDIFNGLYYPTSPYEFSVLPADILGNVYEQFLGSVIHLTKTHQARVEVKPEVKKAGGVYYTPKYIVDYIVERTVGKLIGAPETSPEETPFVDAASSRVDQSGEDAASTIRARKGRKKQPAPKTPNQIAKLKILDPACGSGSFLVGAYKYLLAYHRDWYFNDGPQKHTKEIYQGRGGQWYLTTAVKKRILLNNIHGVDIDSQAVEVTKLNLLLCVLENENQNTIGQMSLIHQRVLPDLSNNIKCGNSLIGSDFYQGQQLDLFDTEAQYRINAFDWETEFPQIFKGKNPGFDAVIGNPPYIRMEKFKELKEYLAAKYETHADRADIYYYFVERGIAFLNRKGKFGFIVSNSFTRSRAGKRLRSFLSSRSQVDALVEFGDFTPFIGASVYPIIIIAKKHTLEPKEIDVPFVLQEQDTSSQAPAQRFPVAFLISRDSLGADEWVFEPKAQWRLREQLLSQHQPLRDVFGPAKMGIKTGLNEAFIISGEEKEQLLAECPMAESIIKPYVAGRDMDRWTYRSADQWLIYIPHGFDITPFSAILTHMKKYRAALQKRATKQNWYELQQPQEAYARLFNQPKIIYPDMSRYPKFSLDTHGMFFSNTGYFIESGSVFLLGLLNSRLLWFVIRGLSNALRGGLWRFRLFSGNIERLPIRQINFTNATDKTRHDRMVELVERMLGLHKSLSSAKTDHDKTLLQRQITATDKQIDQLVYELYGLSDEEIAIVEGAGA